uniref:Uncharacterized protein n=1 Tax=Anguilla anguilla TaxID=7936 RepID=A0A0E9Y2B5_ANGAN
MLRHNTDNFTKHKQC